MMMKRAATIVLSGLGLAVLAGCPIYPDARDHRVCLGGECYECPDTHYQASCGPWICNGDSDCPGGYTCSSERRCKFNGNATPPGTTDGACAKPSDCSVGTCGTDNKCHAEDCTSVGCPSNFVCTLAAGSGGSPVCLPFAGDGGATSTCKKDGDCKDPAGSKCLTGTCVAPADQCADTTQCPNGGQCVNGACTPTCGETKPCPTGYSCDANKVCTGNPTPCTTSATCTGGTVCVEEHCVKPCDPGGACSTGLKCVDGGCIPDERPVFTCGSDGPGNNCQEGSICLRHSCYIGCDADAGNEGCKSADEFNQCKGVTTTSGTYHVCGSTNNLGTECDPTQGKNCALPLVCIDGFCK